MNTITISGRLTKDPEQRETSTGTKMTSFSVAVTRAYVAKGKERETDFLPCRCFGNVSDFLGKYFSKGSPIEVIGSLETRRYTDQSGANRTAIEIVVSDVRFPPTPKQSKEEYEEIPF